MPDRLERCLPAGQRQATVQRHAARAGRGAAGGNGRGHRCARARGVVLPARPGRDTRRRFRRPPHNRLARYSTDPLPPGVLLRRLRRGGTVQRHPGLPRWPNPERDRSRWERNPRGQTSAHPAATATVPQAPVSGCPPRWARWLTLLHTAWTQKGPGGLVTCLTRKKQGHFASACTSTQTAGGAGRGRSGATPGNCAWPTPGDTTQGRGHGHAWPRNARTRCPVPARPTSGRTDQAAGCAAGPTPRSGVAPRRRQRTNPAGCGRPDV